MLNGLLKNWDGFRTTLSEETPKKYRTVALLVVAIVVVLELFVFNFKWIDSAFDAPISLDKLTVQGVSSSNGKLTFGNGSSLDIVNLNKRVNYLYFNPEGVSTPVVLTISAQDEANSYYLGAPSRTVLSDIPQSQYIKLNFSGNISALRITTNGLNETIDKGCIVLNPHVPLIFSWARVLFLFVLLMAVYVLRPRSFLYRHATDLTNDWQKTVVMCLLFLQATLFWQAIQINKPVLDWPRIYPHHRQYYELVQAMKKGHLYLDEEPPQQFNALKNPYDPAARSGQTFRWDSAYYKGKYYVYFGVVPAVTIYLPYNLLTGHDIPNYVVVYLLGLFVILGIFLLLWAVIQKWYKKTPFGLYLLLSVVFSIVCGLGYAVHKPDFYSVPTLMGVALALFGLWFWLNGEVTDKKGKTRLSKRKLAYGALCLALIAGCRPQLLICLLIGVVIFWGDVFQKRTLFSSKSVGQTVWLCLPFVAVAAGVMWYNYARFGSLFDFGANYNLTTNDMTHRGYVAGRNGLALFTYFLQPFHINAVFPFFSDFTIKTTYQGLTLVEEAYGGVFWLCPPTVFALYGVFRAKHFHQKTAYAVVVVATLSAIVLGVVDAQMAGLIIRYHTDFLWLLLLASCITIFMAYQENGTERQRNDTLIHLVLAASLVAISFSLLEPVIISTNTVREGNPLFYYTLQHLVAFWL